MRRLLATTSTLVCIATASASIAWATAPRHDSPSSSAGAQASFPARSAHLVRIFPSGPSGSKAADVVTVGKTVPISLRLPATTAKYTATITLSFQYRTTGRGGYLVLPNVLDNTNQPIAVRPFSRNLAPSHHRASTTTIYRTMLRGGSTYRVFVTAAVTTPDGGAASVDTSRMLVELEAWPAG